MGCELNGGRKSTIYAYINEMAEVEMDTIKDFADTAQRNPNAKTMYIDVNIPNLGNSTVLLLVDRLSATDEEIKSDFLADFLGL